MGSQQWYSASLCDKVENILKGSLDSIPSPSPSVKTQMMGGKVCMRCKGKALLGDVNKLFCFQKFVNNAQQYFSLLPQANFPANNLNFHWRWRWWDWIQAIFLSLFYFTFYICSFLTSWMEQNSLKFLCLFHLFIWQTI